MKILLIEDTPADIKLFTQVLQAAGHEIVHTDNAEDAWQMLRKQSIDLILTDVLLPGADGLAFAHRLRTQPSTRKIPIVAMSAVREWPFRRIALEAGCDGYIEKPVDTRTLAWRLEQILAKNRTSPATTASP
jgi:CheY-like chemotaxis protein